MLAAARWGRLGIGRQAIAGRPRFAVSGGSRWASRLGRATASPSVPSGGKH